MSSVREREIGERLRKFREGLLIPRSRFAVQIGFGSERLASYESGRAPLPYSVFKSISSHYELNPVWLAEGLGPQQTSAIIDEGFASKLPPRALFSEAYDQFLSKGQEPDKMRNDAQIKRLVGFLRRFADTINDDSRVARIPPETIRFVQTSLARLSQAQLAFDAAWNSAFEISDPKKKR